MLKLGDIGLIKKYLFKGVNSWAFHLEPTALIEAAEKLGWHHFADDVQERLVAKNGMAWIDSLWEANESISDEGRAVITQWIQSRCQQSLQTAMKSLDVPPEPTNARDRRKYKYILRDFNVAKRGQQEEVMYLARLTACLNLENMAQNIIVHLADNSDLQFLTETYGPAVVAALDSLKNREHNSAIAQQFADAVQQRIQSEFPTAPESHQDWSREGELACGCEFCAQVNEFLPKSDQSSMYIYQTLKRNLVHVEAEIEKQQIEAEVWAKKKKSKFDGTITKNQSQYDQRLKLYDVAQEIVKQLPS